MKKRFFAILLVAVMVCALAACGNNSQDSEDSKGTEGSTSDFKVGAIYIGSQHDTSGYTYQHNNGITTAMENLGLDPETQLLVVDNVEEDYTQTSNAIDQLANQGCDIIFAISFGYIDAVADKAEEYPEIIFSHATGYLSNDTNFNNYFGRIYQARYLTGIAAGLKSLELGNNNIGYVAAYNTEYAETCSGINGFTLGVQSVNPDAVVHVNTINSWGDETLERQAAEALVDTYDCCVIAQHVDSAQPQLVANDRGIYGCGYNSDMTSQAPDAHLTAAIWHWEVYYQQAIQAALDCDGDASKFVENMNGSEYYAGVAENFVDYSPLSENCAENTQEIIDAVLELMISGEWDVFTGVKLSYDVAEDGTVTIIQTEADLVDSDGNVIVSAGGESVDDSVIKGSMNYNVEGVIAH